MEFGIGPPKSCGGTALPYTGLNLKMTSFCCQVYSLSIENWHWKEHTADVEGEAPTPRSGHSAIALPGDRFLLVFGGGIPDQNAFFGTVSLLDTFTWTWTTPTITVSIPVHFELSKAAFSAIDRGEYCSSQILQLDRGTDWPLRLVQRCIPLSALAVSIQ